MLSCKFLQRKLLAAPVWFQAMYGAICAFGVYCCMYAFRKPFTVGEFKDLQFLNIDYKVWLIIAQVIGYMFSKFYGIRFISSLKLKNRSVYIISFISISWVALLFFALVPPPFNIVFLLVNGFPLGMVWGLVFSYLEGRKSTELMGVVLSTSFIFSSGFVKTVGKHLMVKEHVSEWWMPFSTGALFFIPMLLFSFLLHHLPEPNKEDIQLRAERMPMTKPDRQQFIRFFLPGIFLIIVTYTLLTVLRDFRDNFANELWTELGYGKQPSIFTNTEVPVSLFVLLCMVALMFVRNNFKAFLTNHYLIIAGYSLCLVSTAFFVQNIISAHTWMILLGSGLYVSYVPFNCLYFERMIASFQCRGNVGFIMYLADAFGYLGSVLVLLVKQFSGWQLSWLNFFVGLVIFISLTGIVGTIAVSFYFKRKYLLKQTITPGVYAV